MQILCGRNVRNNGIGATQNHQNHHQLENSQRKTENVEISKSWLYIGSANLSPSAWYYPIFPFPSPLIQRPFRHPS